jgi:hypothetical protein
MLNAFRFSCCHDEMIVMTYEAVQVLVRLGRFLRERIQECTPKVDGFPKPIHERIFTQEE